MWLLKSRWSCPFSSQLSCVGGTDQRREGKSAASNRNTHHSSVSKMLRIKMKDCYERVITWRIYLFFVYACEYHLTMTDCKYSCKSVYLIEGFMIFDKEIFDKKRVWVSTCPGVFI